MIFRLMECCLDGGHMVGWRVPFAWLTQRLLLLNTEERPYSLIATVGSSMMRELRQSKERPYWIGEDLWAILEKRWEHPDYVAKCAKAKKNRASDKGGCINTGGFINSIQHYHRLVNFFNCLNLYSFIFYIIYFTILIL